MTNLVLASSSPRRIQLLQDMGYTFTNTSPGVDETRFPDETAETYCLRLAQEKARVVAEGNPEAVVIAADTIVFIDNKILGKPKDFLHFTKSISLLSDRTHTVLTAVAIVDKMIVHTLCVKTLVQMRFISQEEAQIYWQTKEPCDKAGGYAIQGKGGQFIKSISGSYSNVVGLPQVELFELLSKLGIPHE